MAVVSLSPVAITIFKPRRMQLGDGLGGGRLDRIGDGDEPGELAADGQEHHRLAVFAHRLGAGGERRGIDAGALHQPLIAEQHVVCRRRVP